MFFSMKEMLLSVISDSFIFADRASSMKTILQAKPWTGVGWNITFSRSPMFSPGTFRHPVGTGTE